MSSRKKFTLRLCSGKLVLGERTLVMGVLNVTPDSFSDGRKFLDAERAIEQAMAMERGGADLLDMGGESTRPGSTGISAQEELARVLPVVQALRGRIAIPVSIDTQKYELLQRRPQLAKPGYPLLVGTSRKGFLGATLAREGKPAPPEERIWGTAATVTASILNGAHIVRVHEVNEMVQVARVADCLLDPKQRPNN